MTPGATLRRALFAVLLIAAAFFMTAAPETEAAIGNQHCIYYSDASHSTQVGECGPDCCGKFTCTGVQTPYKVCGAFNCIWCPPVE